MKKLLAILLALMGFQSLEARHIKGGEISYRYAGAGPNGTDRYELLLRLFLDCNASGSQLDNDVNISIYSTGGNTPAPGSPFNLPLTDDEFINLNFPNPCIVNPSPVCYRLRTYSTVITLPRTFDGFTAVFQRCCRIDGINNLSPNVSIGSSYVTQIHGLSNLPSGTNSSPFFVVKDTVLICQNRPFRLDFGATDPDRDSLTYEFCDAYTCPSNPPVITNPPPANTIGFVGYSPGYTGTQPLGPGVTINRQTGLISGIAPPGGNYVVCVCVSEWRDGKRLSTHRKDFNVQIDDRCDFASAQLNPSYINCDGYSYTFKNEAPPSPLINSYYWDFGIPNRTDDTSTSPTPTFTFPDTGVYVVKLIVNKGQTCPDSATTMMKVYPGFFAGFTVEGACKDFPFRFTDTTKTRYGTVTGWNWNFGDETSSLDVSDEMNPTWKYNTSGSKLVSFIVQSTKGCIDTVLKDVIVYDKPPITLPFDDTLICSIDTLRLAAAGLGNFSWGPAYNILNANTANPLVYPKITTNYIVTLDDRGCINKDTVRVRVVDFVTLNAKPDSTICLTDTVQLQGTGDGLAFRWSPAGTLDDPNKKNPVARPTGVTTTYTVIASIGKCSTTDQVTIRTVPYPQSFAGPDTTICFDDTATLRGRMIGSSFTWSPNLRIINSGSLSPYVFPLRPTNYVLSVYDTLGCPKPGRDTVLVFVLNEIFAFAGRDTAIVVGQPLQLNASGAEFFTWSPPFGLNRNTIGNPIAILSDNMTYYLRATNETGCYDLDTINIQVFKTKPDIFVPNAFTPDGRRNNLFRPAKTPGISNLDYFRVYNRWGQLVFSTSEIGRGWDGTIAGKTQNSGTYVWVVQGRDYTGKTVTKKGVMVLIR
ncbi:MAG TPA: gliding motility-associated C-terminal domain-containing protein [Chitinophagaceae bacterium]